MADEHPSTPDAGTGHPLVAAPGTVRPRRRWPWVLLIVVVLLIALAVAAEAVVRSILPGVVRGIVIEQLDLPADQQLDVSADGVLLAQLLAGRLDELHLSTDSVTLGGITGAIDVTADGVALDGAAMDAATGEIRIDQEQFSLLLADADLPVQQIAFEEPDVTIQGSIAVLGLDIPISFTGTPGAEDGDLVITPVRVLIAGLELDAAQVAGRFGGRAAELTAPQRICIADRLPAGIALTDLDIRGTQAVIGFDVDGAITVDPALQRDGVCD